MPNYFVHESSYVDDGAVIGDGHQDLAFLPRHARRASSAQRCNLGQNVVVMPGTRLGNNVKVQNNVSIYEGVVLEDDVFCGPCCVFTNVINPRSHVSRKSEYQPTLVRRGASIGANATIVCGVTLGEYSFIGAGAVVRSDVPDYALMVGVPGPAGRLDVPVRRPAAARSRDGPPVPPAGRPTGKRTASSARLTHPAHGRLSSTAAGDFRHPSAPQGRPVNVPLLDLVAQYRDASRTTCCRP